jgi:MurNAc alpha-1-phosphate uridylyltransferase
MGAQIIDPGIVDDEPLEPFSFTRVWRRLQREGRLFGAPLGGFWMHIGDPASRAEAEARLAAAA